MNTATVQLEFDGRIAVVTLMRPDKRNAVSLAMFDELAEVAARLAEWQDLRVVVLHGAGDHFCAGIDTTVLSGEGSDKLPGRMQPLPGRPANFFQHAALAWQDLPVPVIAALHGVVYGAGLQIAMGADLRIAAPSTRCSVMEIRWGIIPDMGLTATMRHLVRLDALRELVYTGRVVDADEARSLGLLTTVADKPLDAAMDLARTIAANSPDAVRAAKDLLRKGFDEPVAMSLGREAQLQLGLLGTRNQAEAVQANLEKRPPSFTDGDRG